VPSTLVVPVDTRKVVASIVKGSIEVLKVAVIKVVVATPVALSAGTVESTVGADPVPVVKVQILSAARALPLTSLAPVVIVAVYSVSGVRSTSGVKVAVKPLAERATVPATAVAPVDSVKVVSVIVAGSIAVLKVAVMDESIATPVAPAAGTVELTVGPAEPPPNFSLVPLHPAIRTTRSITTSHILEYTLQLSECALVPRRFKPGKLSVRNLILSFISASC
jgi:hypothetical protein